MEIRDVLKAKHGGVKKAYLKEFQVLLNDPETLSEKFAEIAAMREDIEFDGSFTKILADRIKLVNDNIAALQTMAGASPEYATQVEKAGVDVTDRQAVQSFVVESGFMEDESIDCK